MDALCMLKFYSSLIGSLNVTNKEKLLATRDNVALPLTGQKQHNHVEF